MESTVNFYSAGLQALLAEGILDVTLTSKVYIWQPIYPRQIIVEPTCVYAKLAHMRHFLYVCLSACDLTEITLDLTKSHYT